jgi:hypothetical protein
MLLIIVLLNYGTLAKLILAKLASKNRMPSFMRPDIYPWLCIMQKQFMNFIFHENFFNPKDKLSTLST